MTWSLGKDKILFMLNYAICEISGKQYKIIPGKIIEVNLQKEPEKDIQADVLLMSEGGKLKIGNPYLKEKLTLSNAGDLKGTKIRVAKFHAKANYRKTIGFRPRITKVTWVVKNAS